MTHFLLSNSRIPQVTHAGNMASNWKSAARKMKAVGAVHALGGVKEFAEHTNATRRSARLSYSRPENKAKLEAEVKAKLEQKRKDLKEGNIVPKHTLTAKERLAQRLGKNKAPAPGSTGLTDIMEKNKVVDWEDEEDEEEDEEMEEKSSGRGSKAGSSRGISKRSSQGSARGSSRKSKS